MSTMDRAGNGEGSSDPGRWGIAVVSDLHLSRRCHPPNAPGDALHDGGFARFLGHLRRRAAERRSSWRLVILGDLIDLPHASVPPTETVAELTRVAADHPRLFEALGEFLAAGLEVEVVAGNHDIALLRRAVRERFADLVLAGASNAGMRGRMVFHPWIFHVPGVLYAEHGSQYHDITRVPELLGLDGTDDRRPLGRPLIAELERYLRGLGERRTRAASRAAALLGVGQESLRFAGAATGHAFTRSSPQAARQRAAYQALTLRRYAAEVGITHDALVGIDELTVASAWSIAGRLARTWIVGPSARAARGLVPRRGRLLRPLWQPADQAAYLRSAWPAVHHLLCAAGQAVPFYVFGHTHYPEELALADGTTRYLNAGSWESTRQSAAAPRGTFVEITGEPGAARPVARLLRWNDEAGRPEPVLALARTSSAPGPSPWCKS
jgi:UDP-2,3-diacylglucosamine pyrophosphatase LpxH